MARIEPVHLLDQIRTELVRPGKLSHKGQNGRILIIGGSEVFHASILWAASTASRIIDYVHFSSTQENQEIFINLKSKFLDGIVIKKADMDLYAEEDEVIYIGPGMERGDVSQNVKDNPNLTLEEINALELEQDYTYAIIRYLIFKYPDKKFVLDAGGLQMTDISWFSHLKNKVLITPHAWEFKQLFGYDVFSMSKDEKVRIVEEMSKKHNAVILLKNVVDIVSDGNQTAEISGGNAGLAKGGSGDILSGMAGAFYTKNSAFNSAVLASYIIKSTAEDLYEKRGLLYNSTDIVLNFSRTAHRILDVSQSAD